MSVVRIPEEDVYAAARVLHEKPESEAAGIVRCLLGYCWKDTFGNRVLFSGHHVVAARRACACGSRNQLLGSGINMPSPTDGWREYFRACLECGAVEYLKDDIDLDMFIDLDPAGLPVHCDYSKCHDLMILKNIVAKAGTLGVPLEERCGLQRPSVDHNKPFITCGGLVYRGVVQMEPHCFDRWNLCIRCFDSSVREIRGTVHDYGMEAGE